LQFGDALTAQVFEDAECAPIKVFFTSTHREDFSGVMCWPHLCKTCTTTLRASNVQPVGHMLFHRDASK
jgi:hypothetical protein